ncbi:hypothetical protein DL762_010633 [Monosporascus cannonballus]|uniref:Protein kinase domain-containing protein n=1 Tax=Monosporascus cannonballus TaxID=155416 RepID=A0ABY0GQR4_9PEZI|nr:hypothetical protein DL762_010633 [Monosporascus cannonballus]
MWWSVIGTGASSFVTCTDKKTVLKSHKAWEDGEIRPSLSVSFQGALRREAFMYQHLGMHPNIPPPAAALMRSIPDVHALRLELAPFGNLRGYIWRHKDTPPPVGVRLDMTLDAARALGHLHSLFVQLSDVSCRNLLFDDHRVKLCDFGSSLIQGQALDATDYEEAAYELLLRGRPIMAWVGPFEGDGITEIEEKLAQEVFPSLEGVVAGEVIERCWHEKRETVAEVVAALQKVKGGGGGKARPVSAMATAHRQHLP